MSLLVVVQMRYADKPPKRGMIKKFIHSTFNTGPYVSPVRSNSYTIISYFKLAAKQSTNGNNSAETSTGH